jgi:hypothetical protein
VTKLLTAAELMAATPPFQDAPCETWGGTVRVARLTGPDKLRFALRAADMTRDESGRASMTEPRNWAFAVDLIAASIVDAEGTLQFADPEPRAWLSGEVGAVSELLGTCLTVNGLGETTEVSDAKKD